MPERYEAGRTSSPQIPHSDTDNRLTARTPQHEGQAQATACPAEDLPSVPHAYTNLLELAELVQADTNKIVEVNGALRVRNGKLLDRIRDLKTKHLFCVSLTAYEALESRNIKLAQENNKLAGVCDALDALRDKDRAWQEMNVKQRAINDELREELRKAKERAEAWYQRNLFDLDGDGVAEICANDMAAELCELRRKKRTIDHLTNALQNALNIATSHAR